MPNLFAPFTEYHVDLSAANSTLNIPLKDLVLTYQRSSASALRISIAPKDAAAPVLVDIRRTTIYDGSTIETQTMNSTTVSRTPRPSSGRCVRSTRFSPLAARAAPSASNGANTM